MAASGRDDYDKLVRFSQLDAGEPFFMVRGRDPAAAATARAWAALTAKAGGADLDPLVESALQQADHLDDWRPKRLPDTSHLSAEEQTSLRYQLQRRAWNHRVAHIPNAATLLTEARADAAAQGRARHTDALLVHLVEALGPVLAKSTAPADELQAVRIALRYVAEDLALRHGAPALPAEPTTAEDEDAAPGELVHFSLAGSA